MAKFSLFFFLLFIYLGIWQIERYHYKIHLIATYQAAAQAAPVPIDTVNLTHLPAFQHVTATGVFLNDKTMLLDNQDNNGTQGYDVITPFKVNQSTRILLVDRGWVPLTSVGALQTHNLNPNASILKPILNQQQLRGYIKLPEYAFILGPNILQPNLKPLVIQRINLKELSAFEHWQLYPFIVRLDQADPHGFLRNWQLFNILPERHMAYAVQWFVMALVLAIAYLMFSRKKDDEAHDAKK